MSKRPDWLTVEKREAPLIVSFPHTGTDIPADLEARCVSPWLARKDADWWIDQLYAFARELDATIVHTRISRTVIDANRDPFGASLYPGQATTELVPITTFDGEALWKDGHAPDRPRLRSAARPASPPTMPHLQASWTGCVASTRLSCFMTATRSARSSRACSRVSCRS